jgi:hypothetical protein
LPWIDSKRGQKARQVPVTGATGILKWRHSWHFVDVAMREMECHFFLSAWYQSHQLAGPALPMKRPLTGTMILVLETGLEIDTESGPHGAVTHSAWPHRWHTFRVNNWALKVGPGQEIVR